MKFWEDHDGYYPAGYEYGEIQVACVVPRSGGVFKVLTAPRVGQRMVDEDRGRLHATARAAIERMHELVRDKEVRYVWR